MPELASAASTWRSALALGTSAVLLGGCAALVTHHQPADAPVWSGTIAGLDKPDCGGFTVDLWRRGDEFRGRAYPTTPPGKLAGALSGWFVDGVIFENGAIDLSLYQRTGYPVGRWPDTTWRGVLEGDHITLAEQPPSCGRTLIVDRAPSAPEKG
jgi:hypothetical protein